MQIRSPIGFLNVSLFAKMKAKKAKLPTAPTSKSDTTLHKLQALFRTARAAKVKADRAKKKRLVELVALIRRRMDEVVEAFYDIGEALREILKRKLFDTDGHTSFEEFLKAQKLMSRSTAFKLIKVVDGLSRTNALKLGKEKAFALVAYTDATAARDTAAELTENNELVGTKRVKEAATRDIAKATKKLKDATRKAKRTPEQRKHDKRISELTQQLREGLRTLGLTRLHYDVSGEHVTVRITVEQLEAMAKK